MAPVLERPLAASYSMKIVKPEPGSLDEVFSAIQGEGTRVGERHLFIRMGGCPFRCAYCDTPSGLIPQTHCRVESPSASRKFKKHPNPITPEALFTIAGSFLTSDPAHRAVVITGGEPLWQAPYLKSALPLLREYKRKIYLETAGAHPGELQSILEYIDIIAMDIKLPSTSGMKPMWSAHRDFLRIGLAKEMIVKIVVTRKTLLHDLEQVRDLVADVDKSTPVILQPVTPAWKSKFAPTVEQLLHWQSMMSAKLDQVRIIPQVHRALGDH
jgi:organic radical activating enzyme